VTATVAPPRPAAATAAPPARTRWWRRPLLAAALLLAIYGGLSLANDPRAFMASDVGGKVATLRAMDARGDLHPDLGYWAHALDPRGALYPIVKTDHRGSQWVNVTTLPMLYAAYPLYELGGVRAILVLPMLGGVLTALGARALARRLGGRGDLAFWLVGLATPVVVYSLDFWEHTLGLAATIWAVVLLLDVADRRAGWRAAAAAGALFGVAATMRTEALVYAAVAVVVVGWAGRPWPRRDLVRDGAAAAGALLLPLLANTGLEVLAFGSPYRASRTSTAASGAASSLALRANEAVSTTIGLNGFDTALDWLLGAMIVLGLAVAALRLLAPRRDGRLVGWLALGVAALGYGLRLRAGLSFLPGLLVCSPLVVVGLVVANRRPTFRRPVAIALLALPLVWLAQFGGGAGPQWGGRYELTSGLLLAVVAAVALERVPWRGAVAMIAVSAAATGVGLAWLAVRTHDYGRTTSAVAAEPGPIVTTSGALYHFWREGGASYTPTRPWLTAPRRADLAAAVRLLDRLGATSFTLVSQNRAQAPPALGPYRRRTGRSRALVETIRIEVTRYAR